MNFVRFVPSCVLLPAAAALLLVVVPAAASAQSPLEAQQDHAQEGAQPAAKGGSSAAGIFAPVLDAEHRPITAGGTVKSGPIVFQEVAQKAGLTTWQHVMGSPDKRYILESIGSGVAILDYDNDGWPDIYLVNGSTQAALEDANGKPGKALPPHAALFHNNHDGTFTDVTEKAGVANNRWGFGAAVADFDNDGFPDIYVTNFGKNRLYHNNHDGTFTDIAEKAGVTLGNWSTGATWGDYDGDGLLDLFVPGYVHTDLAHMVTASDDIPLSFCSYRGVKTICGPRGLPGEPDHLFHNNGDGTFTDVSEKAGVADKAGYYGLTSLFVDINNDGRPDLLVGNDSTPNYLYINNGDGTFTDQSYPSGYALDKDGRETASMGIAVGDYRNNGQLDIFNTTFSDDYKVLYRNDGDANFTDVSDDLHIAALTIPFLGWGTAFLDYDNDGWQDLLEVDGHIYRNADANNWGTTWAQRPLLFHNDQGKKIEPVPAVEGTALAETLTSRGLAIGDLFNNGHLDAVINNLDAPPSLFRNVDANHNHWLSLRLIGSGQPGPHGLKSSRDAIGATLYLTANGIRQRADIFAGGSFASTSDIRAHFGLGTATSVTSLEVHWPSGRTETFPVPALDRLQTLSEGKGTAVTPKP